MAVLSDKDIKDSIENYENIIILNRCEDNITGVGYDLTIGFIRDLDKGTEPELEPKTDRYMLLPGHRYLIISNEYVSLMPQCMATLHSRGSYALKGLVLQSTTIDPNYIGCVYTSLINCSHNVVKVKKGNQFATMVIHALITPTEKILGKNEDGSPKDAQSTLNSEFSNVHEETHQAADRYDLRIRKQVEYEYDAAAKKVGASTLRKAEMAQMQQHEKEAHRKKEKLGKVCFAISVFIADIIWFCACICYIQGIHIVGIILGVVASIVPFLTTMLGSLANFATLFTAVKGNLKKPEKK